MRSHERSRVIVGVDPSIGGLRALRMAVAAARQRGAVLHAVRSWELSPSWAACPPVWYDDLERDAAVTIRRCFDEALGGVPADIEVVACTVRGEPGASLVGYAQRDDDLLYVGSRRGGPFRKLFHRCVAGYCATHSRCPVVVVPPDAFATEVARGRLDRAIARDLSALTRAR